VANKNQFPVGWDEARVRRVIAPYDNQTEDEQVAEDESAWASMSLDLAMRGMEDEATPEYKVADLKENENANETT